MYIICMLTYMFINNVEMRSGVHLKDTVTYNVRRRMCKVATCIIVIPKPQAL